MPSSAPSRPTLRSPGLFAGATPLARGAKLAVGAPLRPGLLASQLRPYGIKQPEILDTAAQIQPGVWQLEIVGRNIKQDPTIHAWIERGDPAPSRFETFPSHEVTLSIPGTAEYVITVAAPES